MSGFIDHDHRRDRAIADLARRVAELERRLALISGNDLPEGVASQPDDTREARLAEGMRATEPKPSISDVKLPVVGEGENLSDKACPRCGAGNPELDVEFCGDRRCPYRPQPRLVPPHSPDPDATIKSVVEHKGYCFECGHELHAPFCPACNPELATPSPREAGLREAAKAVIRQWDTPNWGLNEPTAALINALRQALSSGDRP